MPPAIVTGGPSSDMLTFFCKRCGALKRRQNANPIPICCDREVMLLRRAHLEAAPGMAPVRVWWD